MHVGPRCMEETPILRGVLLKDQRADTLEKHRLDSVNEGGADDHPKPSVLVGSLLSTKVAGGSYPS